MIDKLLNNRKVSMLELVSNTLTRKAQKALDRAVKKSIQDQTVIIDKAKQLLAAK